jgi:hypothetical protein
MWKESVPNIAEKTWWHSRMRKHIYFELKASWLEESGLFKRIMISDTM